MLNPLSPITHKYRQNLVPQSLKLVALQKQVSSQPPWPAGSLHPVVPVLTKMDHLYEEMRALVASVPQARDPFRDLLVKVHIRRPDRDAWTYLGRGIVSQEGAGQPGQSYRIGKPYAMRVVCMLISCIKS